MSLKKVDYRESRSAQKTKLIFITWKTSFIVGYGGIKLDLDWFGLVRFGLVRFGLVFEGTQLYFILYPVAAVAAPLKSWME